MAKVEIESLMWGIICTKPTVISADLDSIFNFYSENEALKCFRIRITMIRGPGREPQSQKSHPTRRLVKIKFSQQREELCTLEEVRWRIKSGDGVLNSQPY